MTTRTTDRAAPARARRTSLARRAATALTAGALALATGGAAWAGVSPAAYDADADPGTTMTTPKTVTTPEVPPKPDVVLLADTTGSMTGALANVKHQLGQITNAVRSAQPDSQFAVVSYRDVPDGAQLFSVRTDLTGELPAVQSAVNSLFAGGGDDIPEAQLHALTQIATGAISFRPGSTRIVAWFGDAPGHDPVLGSTQASTIDALQLAGIRVIAVNVTSGPGLDATGQASAITSATGGQLLHAATANDVAARIVDGLSNLPTEVGWQIGSCDDGLTVSLSPASTTVTSGEDASFTESIHVAADAPQGSTLTCQVEFLLDGSPGGDGFVQTITVRVNDVTPPTVVVDDQTVEATSPAGAVVHYPASAHDNVDGPLTPSCAPASGTQFALGSTTVVCTATDSSGLTGSDDAVMTVVDTTAPTGSCDPGPNPAGKTPRSSNRDGFYVLRAADAVDESPDIRVVDSADPSVSFGPYADGTRIKVVQAPGARQSARPGTGEVDWVITLKGDALLQATDDSGNSAQVAHCLVAPPPA